jgi:hypothetical protein
VATFSVSTAEGYHIASVTGCGGSLSGNAFSTAAVNGDCTITAAFARNSYTLTSASSAGGAISSSVAVQYDESHTFTITPATGYHIGRVLVDLTPVSGVPASGPWAYAFDHVAAPHDIYAEFAVSLFGLSVAKAGTGNGTVTSSPPGIACGSDCGQDYPYGSPVDLTAAADTQSKFTGWSGACTGTGLCSVVMTEAKNVTATFAHYPLMMVTPSISYDFERVQIGGSVSHAFVISNPGSAALTVSSITMTGTGAGAYSLAKGTCPSLTPVIAAGGSCSMEVSFTATEGSQAAILHIASNADDHPVVDIALAGKGVHFFVDPQAGPGIKGTVITLKGPGFGTKKGKVMLGSYSLKVVSWVDGEIHVLISKPIPAGEYDVVMTPKEPKGALPITEKKGYKVN